MPIYGRNSNIDAVMWLDMQEMVFLKAIRRRVQQNINRVDQLINQASAPRLPGEGGVSERIRKIIPDIRSKGGKVTKQELADIISCAGMIVTAVGSLYQAGYLKADLKNRGYIVLGAGAQSAPE